MAQQKKHGLAESWDDRGFRPETLWRCDAYIYILLIGRHIFYDIYVLNYLSMIYIYIHNDIIWCICICIYVLSVRARISISNIYSYLMIYISLSYMTHVAYRFAHILCKVTIIAMQYFLPGHFRPLRCLRDLRLLWRIWWNLILVVVR